jgi:hypothetical protein
MKQNEPKANRIEIPTDLKSKKSSLHLGELIVVYVDDDHSCILAQNKTPANFRTPHIAIHTH